MGLSLAEVWKVLLIPLVALALLISLIPVQLTVEFSQQAWQADLRVQVRVLLARWGRTLQISQGIQEQWERFWSRIQPGRDPVAAVAPKRKPRLPAGVLLRVALPPLRYLGRHTRCDRLGVQAEAGGSDAMESALLTGALWSAAGTAIGLLSSLVRLEPEAIGVSIQPHFDAPIFRMQVNCILRLRLGHAIVAGVWLLRRAVGNKVLMAWAKESWRRKGVEGGGRASDPRPDEDGHGKP